jgi:hypothetical protein
LLQQNKRLILFLLAVPLLLLVPLIAMQFTQEVKWTGFDFMAAAILLTSLALCLEFVLRKFKTTQQRILLCGLVLFVFFLIWLQLAVGIF